MQRDRSWTLATLFAYGSVACGACACNEARIESNALPAQAGPDGSYYILGSVVTEPDGAQTGRVSLLGSLELPAREREVALASGYTFPGATDVWVHAGAIYVAGGKAPTVRKFSIDADGKLVQEASLDFAGSGVADTGFWNNTFITADKAYMARGVSNYVVWNPASMQISGEVAWPQLELRPGLEPRAGRADRANVLRDGRLYQPLYWSDAQQVDRADDSLIAVFDVESDQFLSLMAAPCPGLDVGTLVNGDAYFSNWTSGVGAQVVLGSAPTCVVKLAAGADSASRAFEFEAIAGGRPGAVFLHVAQERALFSAFYVERVETTEAGAPLDIIEGANWRTWSYDFTAGQGAELGAIDWNSGALYRADVDGRAYALIAGAEYATTSLYELGTEPVHMFDVPGFNRRLFKFPSAP